MTSKEAKNRKIGIVVLLIAIVVVAAVAVYHFESQQSKQQSDIYSVVGTLTYAPGHAIYPGISATSINPVVSPEPSTRTFIDIGGENDTVASFIFLNFSNQFTFPSKTVSAYPVGFLEGDVVKVSGEMSYETSYQAYVMNVTGIEHYSS